MALYAVTAGATEVTGDVNQYLQLLTGVMTDQPVTLKNNLTAQNGVKLGTGDPGAGPDIHSQGTDIFLETNGAGTIYLRPNGYGSTVTVGVYDHLGNLTVAGSASLGNSLTVPGATTLATLSCTTINTAGNTVSCGGLTATTATFSGLLTASGGLTTSGTVTHNSVGTLVLAGANTFTGSWANSGTSLMINVDGTAYLIALGH
jgi:hypothetical protein